MPERESAGARPLKELPGFDAAVAEAVEFDDWSPLEFEAAGDVIIPGISVSPDSLSLMHLATMITRTSRWERQRLRLVPPPKPDAANDTERSS